MKVFGKIIGLVIVLAMFIGPIWVVIESTQEGMERDELKKEAVEYLEELRQSGEEGNALVYYITLDSLKGNLEEGNIKPSEIGISEKEMKEFHVKHCRLSAKRWLRYLREGDEHYEMSLDFLKDNLEDGGLSLEDIGTSEEELEELRIVGIKLSAKKWLGYARENLEKGEDTTHWLRSLLREMKKGELKPEDIGTSEEELGKFFEKKTKEKVLTIKNKKPINVRMNDRWNGEAKIDYITTADVPQVVGDQDSSYIPQIAGGHRSSDVHQIAGGGSW